MQEPRIWADFQNADAKGRVRLNCDGTLKDLASQKIQLRSGLALMLYSEDTGANDHDDELRTLGVAEYSSEEQAWVAKIDWSALHHVSDERIDSGSAPRASTRNV
jgi:hypothetical protein